MPTAPAPATSSPVLDDERALSPAKAAAFLGVSVKTLTNWRSLGKGPSYLKYDLGGTLDGQGRRRGSVAYQVKDLRSFMQAHRTVTGGQR
ncbi:MAG: helix-turn-helix domain-containing protein [Schaalia hyovaginalis]|uniref:helix-turn-helix domain-containing protein n=1 Tax=Schaalia hyovaginalis TaxID=29316 RepID=UPI002A9134E7|nr:helix-turn-helix domain-containing protein [Schaalia hyovaginalis]MDY6213345.1 helix-turn-helix domain-containing protein [Schaalia hyovaginalis]